MIDEPSLGLSPVLVAGVFSILSSLKREGYTILLAEQNARKALQHADRGYVMEVGKVALSGTSRELGENRAVQSAYLGLRGDL